jgi:hypothetical protein
MYKVVQVLKTFGIPILSLVFPISALAAFATAPGGVIAPGNVLSNQSQIPQSVCNVVDWLFYGLIVFSVIMVLIAAYGYLTSGGDPEKTKAAGQRLLYAAIAIIVGILAASFPYLVSSFLGGNISTNFGCTG